MILQPPPPRGAAEAELVHFFGAVADRIDFPVASQNAPGYLGVGLSNTAMATLNRNHPNLARLSRDLPPFSA